MLESVEVEEAVAVSNDLQKAKRIFLYGEGRSGLMGKAFAMRLMHGGYQVYVVGETTTPSIKNGDILVVVSGSGSSESIIHFVTKAKEIGAKVILITANNTSEIAKISNQVLHIPALTKHHHSEESGAFQPLGNQFDQSTHLLLDAIIIFSFNEKSDGNINQVMHKRHANLE
ncbi:6-phospho-3-hexuloisomerase [Virgibacillus sp. JSM 102003]|uniref:6-phospho-3-hexuloisomerase n=1 Tax=Virgibacillus sp. JSM 102003 TaxID=1562108 RepID=UPI0035C20743